MSEGTRQVLCRVAFLVGCLAPTFVVVIWCAAHYLPGQTAAARQNLADRLGLEVELAEVSYPRPSTIAYHGLTLADPELGTQLLAVDRLEVTQDGENYSVAITQAELAAEGVDRFWELLHTHLRVRTAGRVRLKAGQVAVRCDDLQHWLVDVQARLDPTEQGSQAVVAWKVSGLDMQQPHRLGVVRNRQTTPPATQWQLETGETPLSCGLAAGLLPDLKRLGKTSSFRGSLWAQETPEGWAGAMAGQLNGVELGTALGDLAPHPLTGQAVIAIDRATFRHGRLESLQAGVFASGGSYGRSLVAAAVEHLGMRLATEQQLSADAEPYRELGLRIHLDSTGLKLAGACSSVPGAVLVNRWGPVLAGPPPVQQSTAALLKMLSPREQTFVTLSRAVEPLARRLPLPAETLDAPQQARRP